MSGVFTADQYRAAAANVRDNPKLQAMLEQAARAEMTLRAIVDLDLTRDTSGRVNYYSHRPFFRAHELAREALGLATECRHGVDLGVNCNGCSDDEAEGRRPNPRDGNAP